MFKPTALLAATAIALSSGAAFAQDASLPLNETVSSQATETGIGLGVGGGVTAATAAAIAAGVLVLGAVVAGGGDDPVTTTTTTTTR